MRIKVRCADCGKRGTVFVLFKIIIISKWAYFKNSDNKWSFWECPKCYKGDEC